MLIVFNFNSNISLLVVNYYIFKFNYKTLLEIECSYDPLNSHIEIINPPM